MIQKNSFPNRVKSNLTWLIGRSRNLIKAPTLLALVLFSLYSFESSKIETRASAVVNNIDGYYVFIESKPLMDHTILGEIVGPDIVWTGQPKEMMNTMMRRLKKQYPKADGIMFDNYRLEHAHAIQFKN